MAPAELTRWRGSAADFHARSIENVAAPTVWAFDVSAPAVVLGSSQPMEAADAAACAASGVDVVRRRSGGGAVLLRPGEVVWFDVVVPAAFVPTGLGDDVGRSMVWLGDVLQDALGRLGVDGTAVHTGAMRHTPWSRLVCFDGLGPGEVTTAAGKLVGVSQRRTRVGSRFQCAVHVAWAPDELVALLSPPRPTAGDLGPVATLPPQAAAALPVAVATALSVPR